MITHRTIACRLSLLAVLAAIVWSNVSSSFAKVPVDWHNRLQLAISVSYQGYADSTFADRAQDSAIFLAAAILAETDSLDQSESPVRAEIFAAMGDFSFRDKSYRKACEYWDCARSLKADSTSDLVLRPCLSVIAGKGNTLDSIQRTSAQRLCDHLVHECPADSLFQLWSLAHLCENMWLMGEARLLHERVVAISASHPDADCRWAIRSLVTLGEMTSKRVGIPHATTPSTLQDSAVTLAERALTLARAQYGTTDTMFAFVADRLGDYYSRLGRRSAAYALWDSAWAANRIHLPPEHIERQGNLDRMANVRRAQGRYLEAEELAKQALELRKKTRGEGHPEVAAMYANLGRIYQATGRYRQAETCFRQVLRIREDAIERSIPLIAESHRQLGQLYYDDGRYALADQYFRTAVDMMRSGLGEQHSWVASCLMDLADMYTTWGRPAEALTTLNEALTIQSRFLGESHPAVASTMEDIARTELLLGDVAGATRSIDRALEIDSVAVSTGALPQVSLLATKARTLLAAGSPAAAESLLHLVIRDAEGQVQDPRNIDNLTLLARAQSEQGAFRKAQATYSQIFAIDSLYHGLNVIAMADARDQYACFLLSRDESRDALDVSIASLRQRLDFLEEGGQVLSECRALQFEHVMHRTRDIMLTAYFATPSLSDSDRDIVANLLITSKGAISNRIFEREREARQSTAPEIVAVRDSLHVVRHSLATLYLKGPGDFSAPQYIRIADSIQSSKDRLEQRLVQSLGQENSPGRPHPTISDDIRHRLPAGSTLVEYLEFTGVDTTGRYAVLTVPDSGRINIRDLGDAEPIDSLMGVYQLHMATLSNDGAPADEKDEDSYVRIARALYEHLWSPVAPKLKSNAPVIVAPDAELYLLSFAGLVDSSGHYLIEYAPIHYLSCGRCLAEHHDSKPGTGALIVCDPDFEADAISRERAVQAGITAAAAHATPSDFATLRSSCALFAERRFLRLPGTRDEGDVVRERVSRYSIGPIDVLADAAASEENLKRLAGKKRLLHLATHGFFLSQTCARTSNQIQDDPRPALIGENPLLLSGLCLAGANFSSDTTAHSEEDGILTAEEVASLALDGTEWVVLSACDTRLGETRRGEGVFGLQRAFQMAGANTVISALWPISDRSSAQFMRSLYTATHEPLYQAMRQCQLDAITDLRKRGQPDHPFNWAAFVAVGGWNPLN